MSVYYLTEDPLLFPPSEEAEDDGLLAVGGDLSVPRLLAAYSQGVFPWYGPGHPILWWTPDPRCVLKPEQLHVSKSLRKFLNKDHFTYSMDTAFIRVMHSCAQTLRPQGVGTWIVPDMVRGYTELYRCGYAHSVETWLDGELVGGLYGVSLGRAFFGESMFFRAPNASKAAFVYLVSKLQEWGYVLIDCQQTTPHMLRFGAREIPRRKFNAMLNQALEGRGMVGRWTGRK